MNLENVPHLGKSGNALPHDHSLILTVIDILDYNWPSRPSVNNTLIGLYWYSNTFAIKDGPKLSYKLIYLILDIPWKVRKFKLFTQLSLVYDRVETDIKSDPRGSQDWAQDAAICEVKGHHRHYAEGSQIRWTGQGSLCHHKKHYENASDIWAYGRP